MGCVRRPLGIVLGLGLLLGACTGSAATGTSLPTASPETSTTTNTTPAEPTIILGVVQQLALVAGQCWGTLPTPQPSTSLPASLTVTVVECGEEVQGITYGNGCLGAEPPEAREPVITVACPGRAEDPFPGTRELERAAIAACLPLFEDGVGERYATSELEAIELVPTEEMWLIGERRYVCTAQPPTPEQTN